MPLLPTKEEIEATNEILKPYFLALGRVAHSWNHLHEELGKVFCALTGLDLSIGMAIWHSLKSDRSQRDILEGALNSAACSSEWTERFPSAKKGVLYLLNEINNLADRRNNAIHAPCTIIPGDIEIVPLTFFGNERARRLHGKDILEEFTWYEKSADALKAHATNVRFALDSGGTWPEKPQMPALLQGRSHG